MQLFNQEPLEPIARRFRFHAGMRWINIQRPMTIADLGCGPKIRFYDYACKHSAFITKYYGVDPLLDKEKIKTHKNSNRISLIQNSFSKKIPLPDNSVDYVVGFAFLEHIDYPFEILNDSLRLLKAHGKAIFTAPSPLAKYILEFLSFKLKLISPREIAEHKQYFTRNMLVKATFNHPQVIVHHSYFEFGLNNLLVLEKPSK